LVIESKKNKNHFPFIIFHLSSFIFKLNTRFVKLRFHALLFFDTRMIAGEGYLHFVGSTFGLAKSDGTSRLWGVANIAAALCSLRSLSR